VQAAPDWAGDEAELRAQVGTHLPRSQSAHADVINVWRHATFPFARRLDYERKLDYLAR